MLAAIISDNQVLDDTRQFHEENDKEETIIDPLPCSSSPLQHESLLQRSKKDGKLFRISCRQSVKSDSMQKESGIFLRNLGLKVFTDKMKWKKWKIGEEYCKNFVLKNINSTSMKIRYEPPSTLFFSTLFPPLILLAAGTTFQLPITFKPLKEEDYYDQINFSTTNGSFCLYLQGLLPRYCISIPKKVDFKVSAVDFTKKLVFKIHNESDLSTKFSWNVSKPFEITPSLGTLQPKSSISLYALFNPSLATIYQASAVCHYGEDMEVSMMMAGLGKYPFVKVYFKEEFGNSNCEDQSCLNFKNGNSNHKIKREFVLHNISEVVATYKISLLPQIKLLYNPFLLKKTSGVLASKEKKTFTIDYNPHIPYQNDLTYIEIKTTGNTSKSVFQCNAYCEGPKLVPSVSLLNFGVLNPEKSSSVLSFELNNPSTCDAIFQFDLDENHGVFCVDITNGKLPHNQSEKIIVSFEPPYPGSYYKRAVLLVHEQGPIFIDMIGTKHSTDSEPPFLLPDHLEYYKVLYSRGLSFYPPHIIQQQVNEGKLVFDGKGNPMCVDDQQKTFLQLPESDAFAEYFDDGFSSNTTIATPHVSLDKAFIWMGKVIYGKQPIAWSTSITVFNHTFGKVVASWVPDISGLFHVQPTVGEILPLKSKEFLVSFSPDGNDLVYKRQLECYVSYKSLRDYRIVHNKFVVPPWLLLVDIVGHTLSGDKAVFYPHATFSTESLVLPPVESNQTSYRTVYVENKGITPAVYRFLKNDPAFFVKPPFNVTSSKYQISAVSFKPKNIGFVKDKLTIQFNDNQLHDKICTLLGSGEKPELLMSNGSKLYFKPTSVYSTSISEYEVQSICQIPIKYKWVVPQPFQKTFTIEPNEGVISANSIEKFKCFFSPIVCDDFFLTLHINTWCVKKYSDVNGYQDRSAKKFKLHMIAKSLKGVIRAEKSNIDFGGITVNSSKAGQLLLFNDFACDLFFELGLKQVIDDEYGEKPDPKEPIALDVNAQQYNVPARTHIQINFVAHAYRRVSYNWYLYYNQVTSSEEPLPATQQTLLCHLTADGVYPLLSVVDVRPGHDCKSINTRQLWNWLNLDYLNKLLDCDPPRIESMYSANAKKKSFYKSSVYTDSLIDFNFGAAPVGADDLFLYIVLENIGRVPCDWSFIFPDELKMELEFWERTGLLDPTELHLSLIQNNKLFSVFPKEGTLSVGEKCQVRLSYKHVIVGTHRFPVLLKVDGGKEVCLKFVGVTVQPGRRYLHFPSNKHYFEPVVLGDRYPPIQLYELFNSSSVNVVYEVLYPALKQVKEDNYDQPILRCLNPLGLIPPQSSASLDWVFSPLENKTYSIDVPISITEGPTAVVTFEATGFDSRIMGNCLSYSDLLLPEPLTQKRTERYIVPEQILSLSSQSINFGNVPLYAKVHQILFLTNLSKHTVSYSWFGTCPIASEVLQFKPYHGRINPGQSAMSTITFCANGPPSFYNINLICEAVDLVKISHYKEELEAWEKERARQEVEFNVTTTKDKSLKNNSKEFSVSRNTCNFRKPKSIEKLLNKEPVSPILIGPTSDDFSCKNLLTLPPNMSGDGLDREKLDDNLKQAKLRRKKNLEWVLPQEPKPGIVHLLVTARTYDNSEFRQLFIADNHRFFIDRTSQINLKMNNPQNYFSTIDFLSSSNDLERMIIELVMCQLIRSLIDDPTFYENIRILDGFPNPYFKQVPRDRVLSQNDDEEISSKISTESTTESLIVEPIANENNAPETISLGSLYDPDPDPEITFEDCEPPKKKRNSSLFEKEENVKRNPFFAATLEEILAEVIGNIMEEALQGEVLLTVRPRVIALPPRRSTDRSAMSFLNEISHDNFALPAYSFLQFI